MSSKNAVVAGALILGVGAAFSYPFWYAKQLAPVDTDKALSRQAIVRGAYINTCALLSPPPAAACMRRP